MNIFNITKHPDKWDFLKQQLVPYRKKNKWGFVRYGTKDFVIDPQYDSASQFMEGFAKVEKNSKYTFIYTDGNPLVPFGRYDEIKMFSEGYAAVGVLDHRNRVLWAYMDTQGNQLTKFIYRNADSFSEGLAAVWLHENGDNRKGFINKNFEVEIDFQYWGDFSYYFHKNVAYIFHDKTYIDRKGNKVARPTIYYDGLKLDEKDNLFGYRDNQNNLIIPHQFPFAKDFSEGLAVVEKAGKRGYVTTEGETFIEMKYVSPSSFTQGLAIEYNKGYIDICGIEYWED